MVPGRIVLPGGAKGARTPDPFACKAHRGGSHDHATELPKPSVFAGRRPFSGFGARRLLSATVGPPWETHLGTHSGPSGAKGTRTPHLYRAKVALFQMSYGPWPVTTLPRGRIAIRSRKDHGGTSRSIDVIAKQVLFQLSYSPECGAPRVPGATWDSLACGGAGRPGPSAPASSAGNSVIRVMKWVAPASRSRSRV